MAISSSVGLASGLDIESLISSLMAQEQKPIALLQTRETKETTKLSSWGQIKNALASLQTAAQAMDSREDFLSFKSSIANTSVASVSASGKAVAGSYSLEVSKLADVQKVKSAGSYAALTSEVVDVSGGSQTLAIQVGDKTTRINIDSSNNTLEGMRDAINNAKAGVTATLVHDGNASAPYRLVLTSNETGTDKAFSLSGVAGFSYDAASGTGSGIDKIQAASNAEFTVDGIAISKSSNTITDAIQGVSLNLAATNAGSPTRITVSADSSGVQSKAAALVKAYNDLNSIIKVQTAYNSTTKTAGTLNGDSTVRTLQAQIRSVLTSSVGGGNASTLSAMGISFQKDGSLALDSTKLQAALDNPEIDVAAVFVKEGSSTGIASKLGDTLTSMLGSTGMVTARTDGINDIIKRLDKQIDSMSTRLTATEARYRAQFEALESTLSSLNSTTSYLTQQLASLSS